MVQSTDPSAGSGAPQPGWYPDPWQVAPTRWWDGVAWTGFTTAPPPAPTARAQHATDLRYAYSPATPLGFTPAPGSSGAVLPAARSDIRGGGVAILGFFGAIALALICSELAIAAGAGARTIPVLVANEFGLWAGLCGAAYIATHRRVGGMLADLGFRMPTRNEAGLGIGIGALGYMVASRVAYVLVYLFPDTGSGAHIFISTPSYALIFASILLACVGAPIVEELYFRGLVQSVLMRNLGINPAIVIQAMLFGAAHFQIGMTFDEAAVRCGTVMVLGLFNGWLRVRTGRLGAGMVAHATYNTIVTGLVLLTLVH